MISKLIPRKSQILFLFFFSTDLISITLELLLPVPEIHINGIIMYVFTYAWLLLFSMFLRFMHFVSLFALLCIIPLVIIDNNLFIHSTLVDIWVVSSFLCFFFSNKDILNFHMKVFNCKAIQFFPIFFSWKFHSFCTYIWVDYQFQINFLYGKR